MTNNRLNKKLYTDVTRLKLCNKSDAPVRFILDKSPFHDDDEEEEAAAASSSKEIIILGRILPTSEIYREGAYQIEMKLTSTYPFDPPQVRFVTKIYHPNVDKTGYVSHELLVKQTRWRGRSSLVETVRVVVNLIDRPDVDYALNLDLAREYMENRSVFDGKALEYIRKYALPRF